MKVLSDILHKLKPPPHKTMPAGVEEINLKQPKNRYIKDQALARGLLQNPPKIKWSDIASPTNQIPKPSKGITR